MGGWPSPFMGTMARVKIYAPPKMNQFDCGLRKNMDTWHENEQNVVVQASHTWHAEPLNPNSFLAKFKSKRIKIRGNSILPSIPHLSIISWFLECPQHFLPSPSPVLHGDALGIQTEGLGHLMRRIRWVVLESYPESPMTHLSSFIHLIVVINKG